MTTNKEERVGQRSIALIRVTCSLLFLYGLSCWYYWLFVLVVTVWFGYIWVGIVGDNVVEFTTGLLIRDN